MSICVGRGTAGEFPARCIDHNVGRRGEAQRELYGMEISQHIVVGGVLFSDQTDNIGFHVVVP